MENLNRLLMLYLLSPANRGLASYSMVVFSNPMLYT